MRVLDGRIDFLDVHTDLRRDFDGNVNNHLQRLTNPICHVTEVLPLVAAVYRGDGQHSLGTDFQILKIFATSVENLPEFSWPCKRYVVSVIINHAGNLSRRLLKGFLLPISFFHVVFGKGDPSALQGNSTFCPSVTSALEGFSSQDGGTEKG